MKKSSILVMAAIAITVTSCTKEDVGYDVSASSKTTQSATAPVVVSPKIAITKSSTNYGAMIDAPVDTASYSFNMQVAGELGVPCLRYRTPVPGTKKLQILTSQYNILMNFNTQGPIPMYFRTDLTAYSNDLKTTIAAMPALPLVAVIENEEANPLYFKGSAQDYINLLNTAIPIMHSYNIPVANGGITPVGLEYLVYKDYMNRGMTTQANDYATRMNVKIYSSSTISQANFDSILIANYAKMALDFVNFHWRSSSAADSQGLGETIAYLKKATGKPVITNEIGQYDSDPATLTSVMQTCKQYGCPFVVWYSDCMGSKSYPLNYSDGSLTATGYAYKSYLLQP